MAWERITVLDYKSKNIEDLSYELGSYVLTHLL